MKILVADDDTVQRRLLVGLLTRWGYEVVEASDGEQAWQAFASKQGPHMAIVDWMMPGVDGISLCRRVRQRGGTPYVYVLLLTSRSGQCDLIEALEAGADDYLVKPCDPGELKARLYSGQRILGLHEELIGANKALHFQATHDALTGVWNRAAILDTLQRELIRAAREEASVGVVLADLDHFKDVNDKMGHPTGDAVLVETARRMQASVRSYDSLGRYGGEEFLIVLPKCDAQVAADRAEQIRSVVGRSPVHTGVGPVGVTVSMGVAATSELQVTDLDAILRVADAALYEAKRQGRDRVVSSPAGSPVG